MNVIGTIRNRMQAEKRTIGNNWALRLPAGMRLDLRTWMYRRRMIRMNSLGPELSNKSLNGVTRRFDGSISGQGPTRTSPKLSFSSSSSTAGRGSSREGSSLPVAFKRNGDAKDEQMVQVNSHRIQYSPSVTSSAVCAIRSGASTLAASNGWI